MFASDVQKEIIVSILVRNVSTSSASSWSAMLCIRTLPCKVGGGGGGLGGDPGGPV